MIKFTLVSFIIASMVLSTGCSAIWHNKDYPIRHDVNKCPTEYWPFVVDSIIAASLVTIATLIQTQAIDIKNEESIRGTGYHYIALPLYVVSGAFVISTIMGAGVVSECYKKGEQ